MNFVVKLRKNDVLLNRIIWFFLNFLNRSQRVQCHCPLQGRHRPVGVSQREKFRTVPKINAYLRLMHESSGTKCYVLNTMQISRVCISPNQVFWLRVHCINYFRTCVLFVELRFPNISPSYLSHQSSLDILHTSCKCCPSSQNMTRRWIPISSNYQNDDGILKLNYYTDVKVQSH